MRELHTLHHSKQQTKPALHHQQCIDLSEYNCYIVQKKKNMIGGLISECSCRQFNLVQDAVMAMMTPGCMYGHWWNVVALAS